MQNRREYNGGTTTSCINEHPLHQEYYTSESIHIGRNGAIMFMLYGMSIFGCSTPQETSPSEGDELPTCTPEEIPSQLRLLSRKEYDASILHLYYGEGDTCLDDDQCEISDSCRFGVCRPRPCDIHTFVWPYEG